MDTLTFFDHQLSEWPDTARRYAELKKALTKDLGDGLVAMYNPARIVSTGAKIDSATLAKRPCFLCKQNRPIMQNILRHGAYEVLVNPFPIFPTHFTIPAKQHTPQLIAGRITDMDTFAREMPGFTIFYNGAKCGASAPDHMHFQAGDSDFLPLWSALPHVPADSISPVCLFGAMGVLVIRTESALTLESLFTRLLRNLPPSDGEPMMNILMRHTGCHTECVVIPRQKHRPDCYGTGPGQMVISPGSVDLAGVIVTPRKEDFDQLDLPTAKAIFEELCLSPASVEEIAHKCRAEEKDPVVNVGIMADKKLELTLHGPFSWEGEPMSGTLILSARDVKDDILLVPSSAEAYTEVKGVTIGVNFHWQRTENQCFKGAIRILKHDGLLHLINIIPIEDYLTSVISSEMSATSSLELLKAHAVISRSWVMAQVSGKHTDTCPHRDTATEVATRRRTVWYDHDDHTLFDVCADDHCQRYQGIMRASTPEVRQAIEATRGQVLTYRGKICDARFSKCCGGVMEEFEACWADTRHPYLRARADSPEPSKFPDLTIEENAREWILSEPDAFCRTSDKDVLRQVLNGYDQETPDFYRWTVEYDTDTLSELVKRRTGLDFGTITDLLPMRRGKSGRIVTLRIIGTLLTMDIGKELEIRRSLSESHLYSSAFVVDHIPGGFRLTGAGWGHGVGLCQIGAAMMAHKGYTYHQILAHYYPGAELKLKIENY